MLAGTSLSVSSAAIRVDLGAIFVSMELSRSKWLITSLSPGGGEKMSKHTVVGGDLGGLFERFGLLREKARARTGLSYPIIVIQEAGLISRAQEWSRLPSLDRRKRDDGAAAPSSDRM